MVGLLVALSSLFLGLHWRNSPLPKNEGMKRISMVITIIVAVGLLVFFLAPVSLWFNSGSPIAGETMSVPVYRSLGCATVGFGDLYAPSWFGFSFGCSIPVPLPL